MIRPRSKRDSAVTSFGVFCRPAIADRASMSDWSTSISRMSAAVRLTGSQPSAVGLAPVLRNASHASESAGAR